MGKCINQTENNKNFIAFTTVTEFPISVTTDRRKSAIIILYNCEKVHKSDGALFYKKFMASFEMRDGKLSRIGLRHSDVTSV